MASSFTHSKLFKQISFYTQQAFTQRSFYLQQAFTHNKRLHTEHLHTVLLHMASVCTHRNWDAFTHSKLLQKKVFTQRNFLVHNHNRNCSSKTGSRRQSEKDDFETLFERTFEMKITSAQIAKICWQIPFAALMRPLQYDLQEQLHKTIVLRMQPQHQATLTQPLQCVSQHHVANLHVSTHMATPDDNNHAAIPMRSATADSRNA